MWFPQWVSLVTLVRTIMNSNHLAKHKVRTTEPHPTSCRLQRDKKKTSATRIGSTHPTNFTHISVPYVGRHTPPQLSPSEEGHGNSTPDGCTRLQKKRNLVDIIIWHMWNRTFWLAPYSKRSVRQLTRKKQAVPPTTSPNKLPNNNSHVTPFEKTQRTASLFVFNKFEQQLFFQSFYCDSRNLSHEQI